MAKRRPPKGLISSGRNRQSAHLALTKRIVRRVDRILARAEAETTGGRYSPGAYARARAEVETAIREELERATLVAWRGWTRVVRAAPGSPGRVPQPTAEDARRIAAAKLAGKTWAQRLRSHLPTERQAARLGPEGLEKAAKGIRARVATLVRTESDKVSQAALQRVSQKAYGKERVYAWRYTTAGDHRVRPEHRKLDGKVYLDNKPRPVMPNGPGCRCFYLPVVSKAR